MPARFSRFFRSAHITGDVFLLNFAFYLGNSIYYNDLKISFNDHYIFQFLYMNLFWGVAASINRVYDLYRVVKMEKVVMILLRTFVLHLLLCLAFIVVLKSYAISYRLFALKYSLFIAFTLSWRIGFIFMLKFIRTQGLNFRNIIILGIGPVAQEAYNFFLKHPEHGYRVLGFFKDPKLIVEGSTPVMDARPISEVKSFISENDVDEIYCALPDVSFEMVNDLMKFSDDNLIRFKLLPDFRGFIGKKLEINFYDHIPVLMARKEPLDNFINRIIKRGFDIVFALLVLILVLSWLIPLIAILIKLSSRGPIFFKQHRSGISYRPFVCYKFRSMYVTDFEKTVQASKDDDRITKIGKILRKTSLDEIPQFLNVLLGEMSVTGPRPHPLWLNDKYKGIIDKYMVRHFVKPGITGLAQIKGFRGETTDPMLMKKRVEYDIWYIENWSLFLDIKLIFLTVFSLFKGDKNAV